ncbi:hypothetical protein BBO99_00006217 [Phytophthora kernoviae]|uniref:Heat shock factor binding protein 1 n=2 Tax=Phytophthora kernoviae TaxID=325452 RepID=A0A3R7NED1_9STRA|nr:hypothetical protein G195_007130 [Phytophthora kernoviae 00238/432]KAG2519514.1 hypothetical protein JM16_006054 [Phytophthora kernoviae]KAG2523506.1 hypothetical protein JM18_005763 [Phytophthora kernoviae]RLN32148.1 hypothetical protein BBI17_006336 [Phytophthora kernoviae]RLN78072.1 hypothetical protein BBO99_00006217 [Phytophthora kernoviae]
MSTSDASKNASNAAAGGGPNDAQDLTVFVQSLLEQMFFVLVFLDWSIGFLLLFGTALDDMGSRIDELEKSIADLMEQTNDDGSDKNQEPTAPGKTSAADKGESV